jgi:ApaG protein
MSHAVTNGIAINVRTEYLPERSTPGAGRYAFAYTVTITNGGRETAQLRSRHWVITDADGDVQEVRGEGVVGAQPVIGPGEAFEYTSWCVIPTSSGEMHGSYHMVTDGGEFDAAIAPFRLGLPYSLN